MRHLAVLPPLHGILRGDDHDRRQLTVMDALANIAVCEPRGQVVALSLQLDSESQKIHLGVSENDEVPQKVVDHLTKVWKSLASLSEKYSRGRENDLYDWETHEGESPPVPEMIGEDARIDIACLIYTFSISKVTRRYLKWWSKLSGIFNEYRTGYDQLTGPTYLNLTPTSWEC